MNIFITRKQMGWRKFALLSLLLLVFFQLKTSYYAAEEKGTFSSTSKTDSTTLMDIAAKDLKKRRAYKNVEKILGDEKRRVYTAEEKGTFSSTSKTGSTTLMDIAAKALKRKAYKNGEKILGDEKRRVYTGPNPLHNK